MTRSEKRFFKLHSSLQSGSKNYLKLFDAIEKQKQYDEEALKTQFKGETFIKHLPSEKNHLFKLILKSLRAYHSDNSANSTLKEELKNIDILYRKRLFKECKKILKKAKKFATQNDKFYFLSEIISWEKKLMLEDFEAGKFTSDLDGLIEEEKDAIEKLRNIADYNILVTRSHFAYKGGGYARAEKEKKLAEEIKNDPLVQNVNNALSKRATVLCHYIRGIVHRADLDLEEMFKDFSQVRKLLEDNHYLKQDLPLIYAYALNCQRSYYLKKRNFRSARKTLNELADLSKEKIFQNPNPKVRLFMYKYVGEMLYLLETGQHYKVHDLMKKIELEGGFEGKISKEHELIFDYNISGLYFGIGEYNKSLYWLNKILNDNESILRQDIYSYSRLVNLILHYELGNYDLIDYITKSTSRFLSKRERDTRAEPLLLKYIKKLPRLSDREEELQALFREMKAELEALFREDKEEQVIMEYFDVISWLDSKIEGIPFYKVIKKKHEEDEPVIA